MAEKLKSISRRISWYSVLKAAVFAGAWWLLPFWLFVLIALWLYYVPIAGTGSVSVPFWVLMLLSFLETPGWFLAVIFGAVFYLILLIKDLLIIDRRTAYEVLVFVLTYLMLRGLYEHLGGTGFGGWSFLLAAPVAAVLAILVGSYIKNFLPAVPEGNEDGTRRYLRAAGWILFILIWQMIVAGLFLPLDFLYQGATVFILVAGLTDIAASYFFGELTKDKSVVTSMMVFGFLVLVFASARWVL